MVQITLLTIDNYGSWTHTLGNDREHKLQMYQSSLYEATQNMFSVYGGLVFANRFDEFFAITDGISYSTHLEIKTKLQDLFPFEISMAIANAKSPFLANKQAHLAQISMDCSNLISAAIRKDSVNDGVHLIHLDIEGITQMRKNTSPYEITLLVQATHQIISYYCYDNNLLGFFMGGDNFVIVSDSQTQTHSKNLAALIQKNLNIVVNCGIGAEKTARIAMAMATKNLDEIRRLRGLGCDFPRILDNNTAVNEFSNLPIRN
ncbi:GTP cyclohydrolase IIa [Nitrosopumilus ureiphilus]|uniref:GTP cyclohydrolase III n=1 Tax=Nitrosopumilus ureiphilus TaxID=1470067 RepID=A0A7D5M8A0_9ARCH|nr:GTP cyclohydrolase IIa [Nitrosopumilus ureiphilus]QLH06868.1 GTP cyclohydrolase IIa [Nitrosopumilus ureiphilus]